MGLENKRNEVVRFYDNLIEEENIDIYAQVEGLLIERETCIEEAPESVLDEVLKIKKEYKENKLPIDLQSVNKSEIIRRLHKQGKSRSQIAKLTQSTYSQVHNVIKAYEKKSEES